jgi:hypothetical protein
VEALNTEDLPEIDIDVRKIELEEKIKKARLGLDFEQERVDYTGSGDQGVITSRDDAENYLNNLLDQFREYVAPPTGQLATGAAFEEQQLKPEEAAA